MRAFVDRLLTHPEIGPRVAHHRRVEGRTARHAELDPPLPPPLARALAESGITRLYAHQAEAVAAARAGRNVLAATPTASGKSLVFALPVLEEVLGDRRARALFLYPTKALAQDQAAGLRALCGALGALGAPRVEIYDGDTPDPVRRRIKADPPEILITNPDMLHAGILAHHHDWDGFLRGLRFVVLDELHVYRGVFGAHVHHILRRLLRLAARRGARPRFLAASATVGNPGAFAETLAGAPFTVVTESGAPAAGREVVFLQPGNVSPYTLALKVIAATAGAGLRTIAFTKARRITELLHQWLVRQEPDLARHVAPYRAGYLPEERRRIEAALFRGDLRAVLSTSALELGIDVGGLDVCVLVGWPGSLTSAWQRIGRAGRQDRDALVVFVPLPDALDQYVLSHPDLFFGHGFERAVLDPWNPYVAGQHLVCAAAEEPLADAEIDAAGPRARQVADALVEECRLVRDAAGTRLLSFRRRPHRDVSPRAAGPPFSILDGSGRLVGSIDGMRVHQECHPGAVYLHGGRSYQVEVLDLERRTVGVREARLDHYTVVLGEKETEILERQEEGATAAAATGLGRLKVTVRVTGYQKKRLFGGEPISTHPLEAPPLTYETAGFWMEIPAALPAAFAARGLHFMGAIHAAEHALIGLFPLLAIAERGDVGGISYTGHPQVGGPAIFLYDGVPGGAGLAEQGFRDLPALLARTRDLLAACPCPDGCPACIQSPRCGNGNKPLDKAGARLVLDVLLGDEGVADLPPGPSPPSPRPPEEERPPWEEPPRAPRAPRRHGIVRAGNVAPLPAPPPLAAAAPAPEGRTVVFDLETQRGAQEVGGWGRAARMGLALAVVYDVPSAAYRVYGETEVDRLLLDLVTADRVVGFNIDRFDLAVLSAYSPWSLGRIRTVDLLAEVKRRLGFRVSLGKLSEVNLGEPKSADGLTSLRWWKEGRIDLIESYCRKDVEVTRRLYEMGRAQGYLLYRDRAGRTVRFPVGW